MLVIGLLGALLPESTQRMNAAKNLTKRIVNIVAAVAYSLFSYDRISWPGAAFIAAGSRVGGYVGERCCRRLSPGA